MSSSFIPPMAAGGGGSAAFADLTGAPTDNAALAAALAAKGDMTKAVYDPQNAGYVSGATTQIGSTGGTLKMDGGSNSGNTPAGSINTSGGNGNGGGGSINTSGGNGAGVGGSINTSSSGGNSGGGINTSAGGGGIRTAGGGGDIDTTGTGSIGLGVAGTRTTITGAATIDRSIAFPDATGTAALTNQLSAIITGSGLTLDAAGFVGLCALFGITNFTQLLAAFSITPAADATVTPVTSETTQSGIVTALS